MAVLAVFGRGRLRHVEMDAIWSLLPEANWRFLIDVGPLVCIENRCRAFIGTTPVEEDRIPLTAAFSVKIVEPLLEILREKGAF